MEKKTCIFFLPFPLWGAQIKLMFMIEGLSLLIILLIQPFWVFRTALSNGFDMLSAVEVRGKG